VVIKIKRQDGIHEFVIPHEEGMNALSALKIIYECYDRSIAYPVCLCRVGRCGACAMKINGKNVLGCAFRIEAGQEYLIESIADGTRDINEK